jgi:hypothetical protein
VRVVPRFQGGVAMTGGTETALPGPRYVVTELHGYAHIDSRTRAPGASYQVVDTAWNRRVLAIYRSEDYGGTTAQRHDAARRLAAKQADRLNGATARAPEPVLLRRCGHPWTVANTMYRRDGRGECATCRTSRFATANHGTAARFNGGCRCDECRAARRRANRRAYLRRKERGCGGE